MEYMVIMELENGWSLSQMSFHMDSMEWLVESMESICMYSIWNNPGRVKTS